MSFTAPEGFNGDLLYVREDLVKAYAADRAVVMFGWGERRFTPLGPSSIPPLVEGLPSAQQHLAHLQRVVTEGQQEAPGGLQEGEG